VESPPEDPDWLLWTDTKNYGRIGTRRFAG